MIKKFVKLIVDDDGVVKCSKCGTVLAKSTADYFHKHDDASDVWLTQLADDHFRRGVCPAVMDDAKAKVKQAQQYSPDVTADDIYQSLV